MQPDVAVARLLAALERRDDLARADVLHPDCSLVVDTGDRTGRTRLLFASGDALELLRQLVTEHPAGPLLRTRRGTAWTPKAVAWAVYRLCGRLGVKATPYGYRHTYATDALAAGVPDAQVAALLGHGSTAMLHRHYSHLSARTKVLAAAARAVR